MAKTVRTIEQMVDALGGPTALGEWADIGAPAVCNWVQKGVIPRGWHLALVVELKRRRVKFDPVLFGLTDEQARILLRPDLSGQRLAAGE
jgi:hypothetical protein